MPPRIEPLLAAQDTLCGMGLGFFVWAARVWLPKKHAAGFCADFFGTGAILLLLQGYAAQSSSAGVLRWYLMAGAVCGALAAEKLIGPVAEGLRRGLSHILRRAQHTAERFGRFLRQCAATCRRVVPGKEKGRRESKKKPDSILQTERRVLYNSSIRVE